jgi:hypothetical protein
MDAVVTFSVISFNLSEVEAAGFGETQPNDCAARRVNDKVVEHNKNMGAP